MIAAPVMLAMGAPSGWSLLLLAIGLILLTTQWVFVAGITFDAPDPIGCALGAIGAGCLGLAAVYLTRAADDLPSLVPGFDPGSDRILALPGIVLLLVGTVAVGRAVASVRPRRVTR